MPTAASISIKETLELLDNQYSGVSEGVVRDSYAFWLGSGISRERIIGLDGVLAKLLEFLRSKATESPECGHRIALDRIITMAAPSVRERNDIDYDRPVTEWPCLRDLLARLWRQYSAVLSVTIPGESLDHLLWAGLDFANTFSSQLPDVEHLAIGMLVLEGAVTELASANWDGLLEAAMQELGHHEVAYRVTVTGVDLRNPSAAANLYKFHGCALRAISSEGTYRPLLVARSSQITSWSTNNTFGIVRAQLNALVQTKRTLMIGLSAQDANIRHLFAAMNRDQCWRWDDEQTPIVLSEQELGEDQKDLLTLVYGEAAYEAHREEICEAARLQAYAKPLLLALLLQVLTRKLEVLAGDAHAPNLDLSARSKIIDGIKFLRDRVAEAGNADRIGLARSIARGLARARHQLQNGNSAEGAQAYFPIDSHAAHLMKGKPALQVSGQREAAVALGLIGLDEAEATWASWLDDPAVPKSGALRLTTSVASTRVFLAAHDDTITSLLECGAFDEDDNDAVVICSGRIASRQQRSPRGDWRTGAVGPRYLALGSMLREAVDLDDLRDRFRGEIGL